MIWGFVSFLFGILNFVLGDDVSFVTKLLWKKGVQGNEDIFWNFLISALFKSWIYSKML